MTLGKLDVTENLEEAVALEQSTTDLDVISDRVVRYRKLKDLERSLAEQIKETRDEIVGYLKDRDAEFGAVAGQLVVRRRTVTTRRIDTTALKAKEPEIAEQFTKETTADRLEMIDP